MKCANIGKELGLNCGYFWKQMDKGHFQLDIGSKGNLFNSKDDAELVEKIKIKLNGKIEVVDSINKNGNNFIKIADLIRLGFDAKFNNVTKQIEINF